MGPASPAVTTGDRAIRRRAVSWWRDLLETPDRRDGLRGLLNDREFCQLTHRLGSSELRSELKVIGDLMADMALDALDHAARGSGRRGLWDVTWKAASSLSAVVTAALGGSILAFNSLPSTGRYVLAAIAFLAAAVGALRPGEELEADRRRHNSYASLYRRILHYIMTSLPGASPKEAEAQLKQFNTEFDRILADVVEPTAPK
jgi:hypothetical protein